MLAVLLLAAPSALPAKGLTGFEGIELGMREAQVVARLESNAGGSALLISPHEVSRAVCNHRYFRHADYRFDHSGILREISLTMREVVGRDRVIKLLNASYDLQLSTSRKVVRNGVVLSIKGNRLVLESLDSGKLETASNRPRMK